MQRYGGFILLGLAALTALFTSALLYNWLEKQRVGFRALEAQGGSMSSEKVAVAAVDLSWGTTLTAETIKLVPFSSKNLPAGYASTLERVQGRILIDPVAANEPILDAKLAPLDATQGGMAVITHVEKRAMAVRVDDVVGVAGFINPGNRVDVLVTLPQAPAKTKTVLQNVTVLAAGTQIEAQGSGAKPHQVRVITVEVTPEEAEKLALAASEGKVTMALRNYANMQPILTGGATLSSLMNSYRLDRERPKAATPGPQLPPTYVEIIKGGARETLTFQKQSGK